MRRRMLVLGLPAALAPKAVLAQQKKLPRVAYLSLTAPGDWRDQTFLAGLREAGHVDGQTLVIEYSHVDMTGLAVTAAEIVRNAPVAIVAMTTVPALAVMKETKTLPIVAVGVSDPIGMGMAESFRRPGGNVTGLSNLQPELATKTLQMLSEAVPLARSIAIVTAPDNPGTMSQVPSAIAAAKILKIEHRLVELRSTGLDERRINVLFDGMKANSIDAALFLLDVNYYNWRLTIGATAFSHSVPMMMMNPDFYAEGILMAYGPDLRRHYRRAGALLAKVLKGEKAGDIPFEQPTHFKMILNLKVAKALGLEMPPAILIQADEIIE